MQTPITNGLFTVDLDFGAGVFTGDARWLQIGVRTNSPATFTPLTPRQPLNPAPHAMFASSAGQLNTPVPPSAGQVLAYDGSTLAWTNAGAAAGAWCPRSARWTATCRN